MSAENTGSGPASPAPPADLDPMDVLAFWRGAGPNKWFRKDEAFDVEVAARFRALWQAAADGRLAHWEAVPETALALVIVLDQFPRNMFRGTARAFATDALALETARLAVQLGDDQMMLPVERLFLYLPFEHSEALEDQNRACELTQPLAAFPETDDAHRYALAHRDVIRRFGRFPHRNSILGRTSTAEELEFLKQPGSSF